MGSGLKSNVRNSTGLAVARLLFGFNPRTARELFKGVPKKQRPLCGARRRDGGLCNARALCDALTGEPLRGGRCRMHGGLSTCPRTAAGRIAIAESNRRRVAGRRALAA